MAWNITYTACVYHDQPANTKYIVDAKPMAHWLLGDHGYFTKDWSKFGVTDAALAVATASSAWLTKMQLFLGQTGWQEFLALRNKGTKVYWMPDDHGWGGDNWDHTVTRANQNDTIGASTSADVLTHWTNGCAGHDLIRAAYFDNPASPGVNGDIPKNMVGTAAATDYKIQYFVKDFGSGGVEGGNLIRTITIDCISYKNSQSDTDNNLKTMLGPVQKQWLYNKIREAVAQGFKQIWIMSTKDLFNVDNLDGWFKYATERDEILSTIHANGWPVVWHCGDRHSPHVGIASTRAGDAYNALSLCPTSFAVPFDVMTAYAQNVWQIRTNSQYVFGKITVDESSSSVRHSVVDAVNGAELYGVNVPFGSGMPA